MPLTLRTLTEFHLLSSPLRYDLHHMGKSRHKEVSSPSYQLVQGRA